ncbi:MAG: hypothetical protein PVF70_10060 [Anaerolineales bacterium]|jgi:hypothetical protein
MDKGTVTKVNRQVAENFPEMQGVTPSVKRQGGASGEAARYVLTYKGNASLPGGRSIRRIVRVVVDGCGRVIRMSTSK